MSFQSFHYGCDVFRLLTSLYQAIPASLKGENWIQADYVYFCRLIT